MINLRNKDVLGGALIFAVGIAIALYALAKYDLGTFRVMGTGMVPVFVGAVLAVLGLVIGVPALFQPGSLPKFELRNALFVFAGILAYAALIESFGLVAAIFGLVIFSSLSERQPHHTEILVLCVVLNIAAYLIFKLGFNLPIALFSWPF